VEGEDGGKGAGVGGLLNKKTGSVSFGG